MEHGHIPDSALAASSTFDMHSVGPHIARARKVEILLMMMAMMLTMMLAMMMAMMLTMMMLMKMSMACLSLSTFDLHSVARVRRVDERC